MPEVIYETPTLADNTGSEDSNDDTTEITNMMNVLKVTADTTKSKADKTKKESGFRGCAHCLKLFHTYGEIKRHVNKDHRASAKEIKRDLDIARIDLANDRAELN